MYRVATTALILLTLLTACGGGSSGQSSGGGSSDLDLQAARMAAIGGCQAVSTAISAPQPQGATAAQLQAIQDTFNNTPGPAYPGAAPLLRSLQAASTPAATAKALQKFQQWCVTNAFITKP